MRDTRKRYEREIYGPTMRVPQYEDEFQFECVSGYGHGACSRRRMHIKLVGIVLLQQKEAAVAAALAAAVAAAAA